MDYLQPAWVAMAEALLIGLLVGIERESDQHERRAGLRDFISIGLAGGLCGILNQPWLTVAALVALTALLAIFRIQTPGRTGITTEIVGVVTFLLCVLTATPTIPWGSPLAIALTVVLALFLDAREALHRFFVETLTEREYFDTLRFLAVIFVILPVLPDTNLGPYGFLNPRRTWIFVILVCSISYVGYFLQKFLGEKQGVRLSAVLGGIGSTTAATSAFARQSVEAPERTREFAMAAVLANAVQSPRLLVLLWIAGGNLWVVCLPMLGAILIAGLAVTWWLARGEKASAAQPVTLKNTFHIRPALKFGALFALVRLLARASTAEFGAGGIYASSLVGGSVDVDAIAFSLSGLLHEAQAPARAAVTGLLIALVSNAALKTALAFSAGGRAFGRIVLAGFVIMYLAAAAVWLLG